MKRERVTDSITGRLFVYTRYRVWPRMNPCQKPAAMGRTEESDPSTLTVKVRPLRYDRKKYTRHDGSG